MTRTLAIVALLLCLAVPSMAQKEYLWMEQVVTNNSIGDTNGAPPVLVIEEVTSRSNALARIAELEADPDFFGSPPDELAYDANHHIHKHSGTYWPYPSQPCQHDLIASHRSKKKGLNYYVEFVDDTVDDSEIATTYRVKAEKKSDVNRLKAKCEARCGKKIKVKKEKLKK